MGNGRRWSRDVIPVCAGENRSRTDPARVSRPSTNRRPAEARDPVLSDRQGAAAFCGADDGNRTRTVSLGNA